MTQKITVMLVDDSAVIRGALTNLLTDDPQVEIVASASHGGHALNELETHKPDIIILDIEMPIMDGITALPKLLEKSPNSKIIMFSALTEKGADITMKAMSLGAVECIVKPAGGDAKKGSPFQKQLLNILHNLTGVPVTRQDSPAPGGVTMAPTAENVQLKSEVGSFLGQPKLISIGSSTGGPQALFTVMKHLSGFNVPIVLTQHMPAKFTKILAEHINQQTGVPAVEATENMPLQNGRVHVAPGGFHMLLQANDDGSVGLHLDDGPPVNFCKPAVDPMLQSAMDIYGQKVLSVILTGMGNDGLKSCQNLAQMGGQVIAQDEATSVVWGMPGAVAKAGVCTAVLPLNEIGPWIRKRALG